MDTIQKRLYRTGEIWVPKVNRKYCGHTFYKKKSKFYELFPNQEAQKEEEKMPYYGI